MRGGLSNGRAAAVCAPPDRYGTASYRNATAPCARRVTTFVSAAVSSFVSRT
jgi:hypothetical protein